MCTIQRAVSESQGQQKLPSYLFYQIFNELAFIFNFRIDNLLLPFSFVKLSKGMCAYVCSGQQYHES